MDRITLDLISAWRSLRTHRGATAAIVAVLSLGIGLVTTMFALADPFVARPLPYPSAHELVTIATRLEGGAGLTWSSRQSRIPTVRDWQARTDLFQAITPFNFSPMPSLMRLWQGDRTVALRTAEASADALRMLGQPGVAPCPLVRPSRCVLLTTRTLDREFGGDRHIVGRSLPTSDGASVLVTGVLPPTFLFPWPSPTTPIEAVVVSPADATDVPIAGIAMLARLQPGVSSTVLESALRATLPDAKSATVAVTSIEMVMTRYSRPMAWAALAAGLLMLVVCAGNVANLLFSRGIHRGTELATRTTLGATRRDLARLLLVELSMVTTVAVGGGLAVAAVTLAAMRRVMPAQYVVLGEPALTLRVWTVAALVAAAIVLSCAAAAWVALRSQAVPGFGTLRLRRVDAGRSLRFIAVATQSALAMVLVTGTVVLGRSYLNLFGQDTGFSGSALLVTASYPETVFDERLGMLVNATVDRLRQIPGVEHAGASRPRLISRARGMGGGGLSANGQNLSGIMPKEVTAGFFEASGTTVIAGRTLAATDMNQSGVVVNELFARQVWPDRPALGEAVQFTGATPRMGMVVGVVKDMIDNSLDWAPGPDLYVLLERPGRCTGCEWPITYVVRAAGDGAGVTRDVRRVVAEISADAAVVEVSTIQERLSRSVAERIFASLVMSLFGASAAVVCTAGLVGIVGFVTARRAREIAIRVAVGAGRAHVMRVVCGETLVASGVGLLAGFLVARFTLVLLDRVAYQVPLDTWVTGLPAAAIVLVLVSAAVGLTARRALRLPIVSALRQE